MLLTIPGLPSPPGAEKVVVRRGRAYRYPARQQAEYQARVRACWRAAGLAAAPKGPLALSITARLPVPPSAGARARRRMLLGVQRPSRRPDPASLSAMICAALTGLAFDSRQIARLAVERHYAPEPCVTVEITPLGEEAPYARPSRS